VNLLKIDVEKAEHEVLEGIEDADWRRIDQVVIEVHDTDNRLQRVSELLCTHGFDVKHWQGDAFRQTNLYDVFATKILRP
jgi:hypothetical protein